LAPTAYSRSFTLSTTTLRIPAANPMNVLLGAVAPLTSFAAG